MNSIEFCIRSLLINAHVFNCCYHLHRVIANLATNDTYAMFLPNHNDIQEQKSRSNICKCINQLILMIQKQVIILIIGNIQNQTWRRKSQDIENAIVYRFKYQLH